MEVLLNYESKFLTTKLTIDLENNQNVGFKIII